MAENNENGMPAMRPIFLDYEQDIGAYSDSNQYYEYMYGPDLLVAPVIEDGAEEREVYLPGPETWIFLWDVDEEIELEGPMTVTVTAPMGQTPVFYKYDSEWRNLFRTLAIEFAL